MPIKPRSRAKPSSPRSHIHAGLGFALPPAIARLDRYLAHDEGRTRVLETALGIAYPDRWVGRPPAPALSSAADAGELSYAGHPFEIFAFAWQGGDGLQYGMLVHAAELAPRCSIVSYAPVDDGGPKWLGDDADQALANLMGVALRDAGRWYGEPGEEAERAEARADAVEAARKLAKAIGIEPSGRVTAITEGARTKKAPKLYLPAGWQAVPTARSMSVLAPKKLFDPALGKHEMAKWPVAEPELARARQALASGFPASALVIAGKVYLTTYDEWNLEAAEVLGEAYERLGRGFLRARVEAYLKANSEMRKTTKKPKAR